ncbi:hypothetical protein ACIBH1_34810 [Nonomuraea sp. NPDC050663]|uniref:hypothetical protein n=1 Tax=Nonomuraea sp. NPDC050663 TaxID=3364370 RepID=UPI0037ACC153
MRRWAMAAGIVGIVSSVLFLTAYAARSPAVGVAAEIAGGLSAACMIPLAYGCRLAGSCASWA